MGSRLRLQLTLERVLINSFRRLYGHVLLSLLLSFLWFTGAFLFTAGLPWSKLVGSSAQQLGALLPQLFLGFLLTALPVGALFWGPLSCGLVSFIHQMEETTKPAKIWHGFRQNFLLAFRVYALYFFLIFFLVIDLVAIASRPNAAMMIMGAVILYSLILLYLMGLYIPGLVAFQKNTVVKVMKKAFLLTMDNPMVTLIIGFFLIFPALLLTWSVLAAVTAGFLGMIGRIMLMISLAFFIGFYGAFIHYALERLFCEVIQRYDD